MNIEEFKSTRMVAGDKFKKNSDGKVYDIVGVDFEEQLFSYWPDNEPQEDEWWVRCENVEFIPYKEQANDQ